MMGKVHFRRTHTLLSSISHGMSNEIPSLEDALHVYNDKFNLPTMETFLYHIEQTAKKKDLRNAKLVYTHLCKVKFEVQKSLSNHIVSMFIECGSIGTAKHLFDQWQCQDEHTYMTMIIGYIQCGQSSEALHMYQKMKNSSAFPCSSFVLVNMLKVCGKLNEVEQGQEIHIAITQQGYEKDLFVGSTLVDMYAKCGSIFEAQTVFNKLKGRNVVSWNALISGYAQLGLGKEVVNAIQLMKLEMISPNVVTFTSSLKVYCGSKVALTNVSELHNEILQKGFDRDLYVGSTLVDVYSKSGLSIEAKKVFHTLLVRDIVSWMGLIAGYAEHGPLEGALTCFSQMQSDGICPDAAIFSCVLKACGSLPDLERGRELHSEIIVKGFEMDPFVSSTLIDMYTKCRSLSEATWIFEKSSDQNVVSCNALLMGYIEQGYSEDALNYFRKMQQILMPNTISFSLVLKALGIIQALNEGWEIHTDIVCKGFEDDHFVGNSLVDLYAKCGSMFESQHVFTRLCSHTVVSWTALISGYVEHGPSVEALNYFDKMQAEGIILDAALFSCVLKACSNLKAINKGRDIHSVIMKNGLETDLLIGNSLIDMYAKCDSLEGAKEAFYSLSLRNVVSWTTLIAGHVEHGLSIEALYFFDQMQLENVIPDAAILACALKCCASIEAFDKGLEIHNDIIQRGLDDDETIGSSVVDMYAKFGSILEGQSAFNKLKHPSIVAWNALITGYAEHDRHNQEALNWFEQMQMKDICPDAITYMSILKACDSLSAVEKGHEFHQEITWRGFDVDPFIGNTLVNMYAKCGILSEAQQIFNKLHIRNVISWNALIAGYAEHGPNQEALNCYNRMHLDGVTQTHVSFVSVLKSCGTIGAIDKGRKIHLEVAQRGLETDVSIGSTLVDMYAKCGSLLEAQNVFDKLLLRDVVAWNAMIKGYGLNHDSNTSLQFFINMENEGMLPNAVTFICILTACSHNSLVTEGRKYFLMMIEKYSITPTLDHLSCMVDLFARSGSLIEAEKFLETLPFSSSKDVWLPLLTACKTYIDVDLGFRCFQKLIVINPDCASSYMLMSSIYASVGRWDDVAKIEEMRIHGETSNNWSSLLI